MFKQILEYEFNLLRWDLIKKYDEKGMRASGEFEEKLRYEADEYSATMFGVDYTEQLQYGRRAGGFPPIQDIKDWILNKNVFAQAIQQIGLSSLAFLIARKIARSGWNRQGYGGVDLITEVITPERIQMIIDKVSEKAIIDFINEIDFKLWQ